MKIEYLKTLWLLRFEKIRKGEEDAAWSYQEILDACLADLGQADEAVSLLGQLVREERMHMKLAEELVRIAQRNHPECGTIDL
ncbi:MAG TPA: hypothetical protein VL688_03745 [Verrucomicrobiae bacterium]|jgi:hypothetical protein|nr:hypothetical protein [Verrucomicrobiae bacterium]